MRVVPNGPIGRALSERTTPGAGVGVGAEEVVEVVVVGVRTIINFNDAIFTLLPSLVEEELILSYKRGVLSKSVC